MSRKRIKSPRKMSVHQAQFCETLVQLSQAVASDHRFSNWRDAARRYGIEGSAGINSLLIDIARIFEGVWTNYAALEPNWYNAVDDVAEWLLSSQPFDELPCPPLVVARLTACVTKNI